MQNADSEPFLRLNPEKFIEKIEELKIPDLNQKDLLELAKFLSISKPNDDVAAINLSSFLFYFKKMHTKGVFNLVVPLEKLYDEIILLLSRKTDF